ncbi:30S ribosomal protein S20 [Synechocystis salina LEGE 06155]|nr:30S ribosomal protein S20 [Synechocystis salina LEGE 06155]
MANIKSALKRIEIAERNRLQNKSYKSAIKTLMKKTFQSVEAYANDPNPENLDTINASMAAAFSKIDKAVKCKVIHKNNAARKKSRLAKALQSAIPAA